MGWLCTPVLDKAYSMSPDSELFFGLSPTMLELQKSMTLHPVYHCAPVKLSKLVDQSSCP